MPSMPSLRFCGNSVGSPPYPLPMPPDTLHEFPCRSCDPIVLFGSKPALRRHVGTVHQRVVRLMCRDHQFYVLRSPLDSTFRCPWVLTKKGYTCLYSHASPEEIRDHFKKHARSDYQQFRGSLSDSTGSPLAFATRAEALGFRSGAPDMAAVPFMAVDPCILSPESSILGPFGFGQAIAPLPKNSLALPSFADYSSTTASLSSDLGSMDTWDVLEPPGGYDHPVAADPLGVGSCDWLSSFCSHDASVHPNPLFGPPLSDQGVVQSCGDLPPAAYLEEVFDDKPATPFEIVMESFGDSVPCQGLEVVSPGDSVDVASDTALCSSPMSCLTSLLIGCTTAACPSVVRAEPVLRDRGISEPDSICSSSQPVLSAPHLVSPAVASEGHVPESCPASLPLATPSVIQDSLLEQEGIWVVRLETGILPVCDTCCSGFLPQHVASHRHGRPRDAAQLLGQRLRDIHGVAEEHLSALTTPPASSLLRPPVPLLRSVPGYQCTFSECCYAAPVRASVVKHVSSDHHGNPASAFIQPRGALQRLYNLQSSRYFVVNPELSALEGRAVIQAFLALRGPDMAPPSHVESVGHASELDLWLDKIGWTELVVQHPTATWCDLAASNIRTEDHLGRLRAICVDQMRLIAAEVQLAQHLDPTILAWLVAESGAVGVDSFRRPQQDATVDRYAQYFSRVIEFVLRALALPTGARGVVRLRVEEQALAEQVGALTKDLSVSDHDIWFAVLDFWMALLTNDRVPNAVDDMSPLLLWLMASSLRLNASFATPDKVTTVIAGLTWSIRAALFGHLSRLADGCPRLRVFEELQLQRYFMLHQPTPYNALREVQRCTSTYAHLFRPLPDIEWPLKDTMIYRGTRITLAALRQLAGTLMDQVEHLLHDDLLFGRSPLFFGLSVDFLNIMDDHVNDSPGYSFLSDARNEFERYLYAPARTPCPRRHDRSRRSPADVPPARSPSDKSPILPPALFPMR
ncbi:hypothetical protein CALCODRAFT_536526 [Calocera cornea HHB12733]|uniref:C2H2-type domain-containing protein n=1 Tax=Calocera cornea HHB12733 TaxID=1353952 RepID=A0A165C902_9BASI|nr:hypothetical protein CALCODRAFT_536526 [Calocera cornea HHB12733]